MIFDRQYLRESLCWIGAFVATFSAAGWVVHHGGDQPLLRWATLAMVVVAIGAGFWVELRQIRRMDELQRTVYLFSMLASSMCGVLFCALASIGETLGLWQRVAPVDALGAMGFGFALGLICAKRHYG